MKMVVCALLDTAAAAFMQPMFVQSKGVALRIATDEVNRQVQGNVLAEHPEDFRLFELGEWDNASGVFVCHAQPLLLCDCSSLRVVRS